MHLLDKSLQQNIISSFYIVPSSSIFFLLFFFCQVGKEHTTAKLFNKKVTAEQIAEKENEKSNEQQRRRVCVISEIICNECDAIFHSIGRSDGWLNTDYISSNLF